MSVRCTVYKSRRKPDTYLYLRADVEISALPTSVTGMLGELVHVLDLDLVPGRRLAREDADIVRANLASTGFHIQFPPGMVIGA